MYVRPILESNSVIWSPYEIGQIDRIENVQKYFSRRLLGGNIPYQERLKVLKLEVLEERRLKTDIRFFRGVFTDNVSLDLGHMFNFRENCRRSNGNLYKPYCRTNIRKAFWCNRVIDVWNSLTDDLKNCNICSYDVFCKSLTKTSLIHFCRGSFL